MPQASLNTLYRFKTYDDRRSPKIYTEGDPVSILVSDRNLAIGAMTVARVSNGGVSIMRNSAAPNYIAFTSAGTSTVRISNAYIMEVL